MRERRVVVLGSSVARGGDHRGGWVRMLRDALHNSNTTVINVSESGSDTSVACDRFPVVVPRERPDVVVISLSLPNEGLDLASFKRGMLRLVALCRQLTPSARIVLCGPYPCNACLVQKRIFALFEELVAWFRQIATENSDVRFIDLFTVAHDGKGGWPEGCNDDDVHPNERGYELMFRQIDLSVFAAP